MCVQLNRVLEGIRDLLTAPSHFFKQDSEGHWNKATLGSIFLSFLGLTLLLNVADETFSIKALDSSALNPSTDSIFQIILTVISAHFTMLAGSWPLIIAGPLVLFIFLWGTSKVVKASLRWQQTLILCLFFTLPSLLVVNALFPLVRFFTTDHTTLMIIQSLLLLIVTLWSLTVMILGVQAYSGANWQRSLVATLPVAIILFLQASGAITLTILTLMGLNHATTAPPVDPFSF